MLAYTHLRRVGRYAHLSKISNKKTFKNLLRLAYLTFGNAQWQILHSHFHCLYWRAMDPVCRGWWHRKGHVQCHKVAHPLFLVQTFHGLILARTHARTHVQTFLTSVLLRFDCTYIYTHTHTHTHTHTYPYCIADLGLKRLPDYFQV